MLPFRKTVIQGSFIKFDEKNYKTAVHESFLKSKVKPYKCIFSPINDH